MKPVIIGIGGSHSGAGKTSVASLILKTVKGWGAIKYTKTSLYCSIVDDLAVISQEGKDTKKLLDAGAEKVLWVQSTYSELEAVLPIAVGMMSHLHGIVVEGNSAVEIIKPDITIFVAGAEGTVKNSAEKILRMADIVIFQSKHPPETPPGAVLFERTKREEFMQYLSGLIRDFLRNID